VFERDLQPRRDALEADLDAFLAGEEDALDDAFADAATLAGDAQIMIAIATALAIAIGFALWRVVRRRLTEQFVAVQRATDEANRAAAARKELLAVVSHDLRTPLSSILLGTGMLVESATGDAKRHASVIANAADRLRHLVDELVDMSRVEAGTIELACRPLDARETADVVVELLRDQATKRSILLAASGAPATVCADRERILQVLTNLVGNALRFAPPGGSVGIHVEPRDGRVRFAVTDDGPGIAEAQLAHVFERHWQGRERRGSGLGLGLYICKRLVEAHRGAIGVDSKLGAGSTFWFELPA
jgi:signal transduction histidine kinase